MAWRCRFLTARRNQRGHVITPDTLVDFHTGADLEVVRVKVEGVRRVLRDYLARRPFVHVHNSPLHDVAHFYGTVALDDVQRVVRVAVPVLDDGAALDHFQRRFPVRCCRE